MTLFFERSQKAADRNAPLARTCSAALARGSFISDFLTTTSVSAARTRSSHTRWGYELLPLSLRIDFRTVPYAHIPVTVCLRRQGAAGQPAPPPFASSTRTPRVHVAVAALAGRPELATTYYIDRSQVPSAVTQLLSENASLIIFSTFRRRRRSRKPVPFHAGGREKKGGW